MSILSHEPRCGPKDYEYLDASEVLQPVDLVTVCVALAGYLRREDAAQVGWHRSLALALFDRFGLEAPGVRQALASAVDGAALMLALGAIPGERGDPLANAWRYRSQLLALPAPGEGFLEGHPFWLSLGNRRGPKAIHPLMDSVSGRLLAHSLAAEKVVLDLDRVIVSLWGCPFDRLEAQVRVEELAAAGLQVPGPRPKYSWEDHV